MVPLGLVPWERGHPGRRRDAGWRRNFDLDIMVAVQAVEATVPLLEASDTTAIVVMARAAAVETVHNVFPGEYAGDRFSSGCPDGAPTQITALDAEQTRGDMQPWHNTDTRCRS
jgi:hypothetical protein